MFQPEKDFTPALMRPCQTTSTSRTLVSWKRGSTLHERVPFRTTTTRKFHHFHHLHHHHHHHAFLHGDGRYRRVACDELVCLLPNNDDNQAMSIVLRVHVHVHGLGSRKKEALSTSGARERVSGKRQKNLIIMRCVGPRPSESLALSLSSLFHEPHLACFPLPRCNHFCDGDDDRMPWFMEPFHHYRQSSTCVIEFLSSEKIKRSVAVDSVCMYVQ